MVTSCSDVCDIVTQWLLELGYDIDTDSGDHDDVIEALLRCHLVRDVPREKKPVNIMDAFLVEDGANAKISIRDRSGNVWKRLGGIECVTPVIEDEPGHVEFELVFPNFNAEDSRIRISAPLIDFQEAEMDIISTTPWWELEQEPDWIDHSVNCIDCGKLFDERDGYTPEDGEGTVCNECWMKRLR